MAILHAIMDRVVDDYAPAVAGVENDIDEIEDEVFGGGVHADVSRRFYQLTREVIAFQRAIKPLVAMLERLIATPGVEDEEGRYLRDVHDHGLRVQEQADGFRELLQNILSVNLTLETKTLSEVSNKQNEQVKKISARAAILFAPSIVGTIYGMNFDHMPELHWQHGDPFALGLMGAVSLALFLLFKRRHWIWRQPPRAFRRRRHQPQGSRTTGRRSAGRRRRVFDVDAAHDRDPRNEIDSCRWANRSRRGTQYSGLDGLKTALRCL